MFIAYWRVYVICRVGGLIYIVKWKGGVYNTLKGIYIRYWNRLFKREFDCMIIFLIYNNFAQKHA